MCLLINNWKLHQLNPISCSIPYNERSGDSLFYALGSESEQKTSQGYVPLKITQLNYFTFAKGRNSSVWEPKVNLTNPFSLRPLLSRRANS